MQSEQIKRSDERNDTKGASESNVVMRGADPRPPDAAGLTVYFNPFAFTIEQNNEFLRLGYAPMPMSTPPEVNLTRSVAKKGEK